MKVAKSGDLLKERTQTNEVVIDQLLLVAACF